MPTAQTNSENGTPENLFGWIILASIFLYCIAPLTLQFLPALIGLGGLITLKRKSRPITMIFKKKDWALFLAIPALGMISAIWSITPEASLVRGIKIFAEVALTLSFPLLLSNLPDTTIGLIKRYFYIPLALAGTLLSIELNTGLPALHLIYPDSPVFGWILNKNVSVFSLLLPFATLFLIQQKQPKHLAFLAVPTLALLYATDSQATQLSFIIMLISAAIGTLSPRLLMIGTSAVFILLLLTFPWLAPPIYQHLAGPSEDGAALMHKTSFYARLEIWDFISERIKENLLTGFGIDTTRSMTFDHKIVYHQYNTVMHPHNAILQIWIDFGIIGILTILSMISVSLTSLFKKDRQLQTLSMVIFSGLSIYLLVSWSVWASWLIGLMIVLFALTSKLGQEKTNKIQ